MGKGTKRRKKIGSQSNTPKHMVNRGTDPIGSDSPLTFDFSKKGWMKGISLKGFTNKLKNEEMFSNYIFEIFHIIIPTLHEHGNTIIKNGGTGHWEHCHPIRNDQLDLALGVAKSIHGEKIMSVSEGSKLWQFGFIGGIRLVAIHNYKNNYLTPLFIDYHHLIYPSVKHNQKNIEKYEFCPIETYT